MAELVPLSVAEVQKHSTQLVQLPPFPDGTPFVARMRPSGYQKLLYLGKLPNPLMAKLAKGIVAGTEQEKDDLTKDVAPGDMLDLFDALCADALVEPRWEEVKEYLSDEQIAKILEFAQGNLQLVESFRERQTTGSAAGGNGESMEHASKSTDRAKK